MLDGPDAVASDVRVISLCVGNPSQLFDRFISPWSRLIDWLAFRFRVLFLISAGNHFDPVLVASETDLGDAAELQREVLDYIRQNALSRRLLAPAESVN